MATHGTASSYNRGCRCDSCRQAKVDTNRESRHRNGTGQPSPNRNLTATVRESASDLPLSLPPP
jgi:hypothetical protein